jgi:hypothetical protein
MLGNLKLKVRQTKEDPRRIKTEVNENPKKISIFANKPKVPLA